MIAVVFWLAVALALVGAETGSRRQQRLLSLREVTSRIASRRTGRLALVACWAFIGWHLFARYTVPPL